MPLPTAPLPAPPPPAAACLNCGHGFGDSRPGFCPNCGQDTRLRAPTLLELAQQLGGAYVSTEGALWRTLKLLVTQPGALTALYLAGRRRHYVHPLRLYLTISVAVLLLARVLGGVSALSGLERPEVQASLATDKPNLTLNLYGSRVGLYQGAFVCERLPGVLCQRFQREIALDARSFMARLQQANARTVAHWGEVMFVLLPAFALGLQLVYRNRGLRYTEHLVYALHLHAFWYLVLALTLLPWPWPPPPWPPLSWPGLAWMAAYTLLAGRRVFGGRWWPRLLRGSLLFAYYGALLAVAVPVSVLVFLLL
jgi:hypothetical protein